MTTQRVVDLLSQLRTAVDNTRYEEASDLFDQLSKEYETVNPNETANVQRYSVSKSRGGLSEVEEQKLNTYIQAATSIAFQRSELLSLGYTFATGAEVNTDTLLSKVENLRSDEETLQRVANEAEAVDIPVTLPPSLLISRTSVNTDPLPKGNDTTASVVLKNVGDVAAGGVTVNFGEPSGIVVSSDSVTVSEISDQDTVETTLIGEVDGRYRLDVELESASGSDFDTVSLRVINKETGVESAIEIIERLQTRLGNIGISRPDKDSLVKKVEECNRKLEKALSLIDQGKPEKANKQLQVGITTLGAFLNELEAIQNSPKKEIESRDTAFLESYAELAIDKISQSIEAAK